jgi:signal transduction histidine kinase/ActR/RegA family two-component response regulator
MATTAITPARDEAAPLHEIVAKAADWFVPDSMRLDADDRRRALMFLISHFLGPWLGVAALIYLCLADPNPGAMLWIPAAAIAAFWVLPFVLKILGTFPILALLSLQNVAFIVLFISHFYGGLSSPLLPWLIIIPVLAFYYLGDNGRLRAIALAGFAADLAIFFWSLPLGGTVRVPPHTLQTISLVSLFCVGLYLTMMAYSYGRIATSRSALKRELQREQQTAATLVEAKEAADAANRAKSDFMANISHELRTPLNAVIGFSELMVNEAFGALGHQNYKDFAKDIHESGSHLLQIINDILDISKAETGALTLDEGLVDCPDLIDAACRLLRPRLQKGRLALGVHVPAGLPRLRADACMVKTIILNLLTNAVKFTPEGGRIDIEAGAHPQAGFAIIVRDTGIGIAKADLNRVREPFVQADGARNRRQEGAGLGLPLVETMMAQHGGRLELESEQDKGTTARVVFPADRLVWLQDEGASPQAAGTPASSRPAKDDRPRLLVVEDDPDLCELLCRILYRAGFSTLSARNGREAMKLLKTETLDLLITDMVMPEMDGIELIRLLQKERPNIPIIALSGVEDTIEYRRIATQLGVRAALRKPVKRAHLIGAVNDALAWHAVRRTRS